MTTAEDKTNEYLSEARYPLGVSLREHMGRYVDAIPEILDMNNDAINAALDEASELPDGDPRAKEILDSALKLNHCSQAMGAVHADLTELLKFVDWEHSFHEVTAQEMVPGHRALLMQLVKRSDGSHGIAFKMLNGSQVSAQIVLGRDEALQTARGLAQGVEAIDEAEEDEQ